MEGVKYLRLKRLSDKGFAPPLGGQVAEIGDDEGPTKAEKSI